MKTWKSKIASLSDNMGSIYRNITQDFTTMVLTLFYVLVYLSRRKYTQSLASKLTTGDPHPLTVKAPWQWFLILTLKAQATKAKATPFPAN